MDFFPSSLWRVFLRGMAAAVVILGLPSFSATSLAAPIPSTPAVYPSIVDDLNAGRADDALQLLHAQLAQNSKDAAAYNLLCRVYLQEERWPAAIQACEMAVHIEPGNSMDHEWLGRAYGEAAEHASLLKAYMLARKLHAEFVTAVRLDPKNVVALSDLGEFSIEAPGFLGGGLDQAQKIAAQLAPLDATRSHDLLAQMAVKRSDFAGAERELKLAVASSPQPAKAWMNLASLYARRKNFPAMQQAIEQGMAADPTHDSALVHGASLLMRSGQSPQQAVQMLQQYLASSQQSEDEPAFQVRIKLGKLLASQGDHGAAQQQYEAAHAMASNYLPALPVPRT